VLERVLEQLAEDERERRRPAAGERHVGEVRLDVLPRTEPLDEKYRAFGWHGRKAAFFAIARYRGAELAQIVYAGDDVSGLKWDRRGWQLRSEVRSQLLMIALDACLLL